MNENQLFSSFMMLTEHLYDNFVQYILNGRTRAPPETELVEMLQTFQFGAKTDRRALQSKFKSWAKRMNFKDGCLTLANNGKVIIPKEICDGLIMHLHSEEHIDIENVISQIRETYTWTRKNFGMDRDIVVESIMRNCKKEECIKKMTLEIAKLGNSFCSGLPNIPVPGVIPEMAYGMSYFSPYHYPVPIPFPPVFSPSRFPFPFSFFKDMHVLENPNTGNHDSKDISMKYKEDAAKAKLFLKTDGKEEEHSISTERSSSRDVNSTMKATPGKFKKPKNVHEYKILMEAVRKNPKIFPKILISKKNQFLSLLGLAPKTICSDKTLKKFRKELKHKQYMTRDCMIYRERKMLRDRNKLKKCLDPKKQHSYLGFVTFSRKTTSPFPDVENCASQQSQSLETTHKPFGEKNNSHSGAKSVKLPGKKKCVELITIDSSEEENDERDDFLLVKEEVDEGDLQEDENETPILTDSCDQSLEKTSEQPCNMGGDVENLDKNASPNKQKVTNLKCQDNLGNKENLEKEVKGKNCGTEISQLKTSINQRLQETMLKENRVILPKICLDTALNKLSSDSSNLPKEKYVTGPQFAVLESTNAITTASNSTSYSTPAVLERTAPPSSQPPPTSAASPQNNVARVVYPVKLTKISPSKVFLLNKEQKGAYFIIPSYSSPILKNSLKNQPQEVLNKSSMAPPVLSPRIRWLKPKPTGSGSKIDVNEEMSRIAAWIYRMKSILRPCMLNDGEEKSVQKLMFQLDVGIHLVREAKKSLKEIERMMDASESSIEVAE